MQSPSFFSLILTFVVIPWLFQSYSLPLVMLTITSQQWGKGLWKSTLGMFFWKWIFQRKRKYNDIPPRKQLLDHSIVSLEMFKTNCTLQLHATAALLILFLYWSHFYASVPFILSIYIDMDWKLGAPHPHSLHTHAHTQLLWKFLQRWSI